MTKEKAAALRQQWAANGNPPCAHQSLKLLHTDEQYLSGDYACNYCGVITKVPTAKPFVRH
jgi:hypothetical protein